MTLKTTQDYMDMGRNHAANQGPGKLEAPTPYPRSATSWQARAYWAGYDAGAEMEARKTELLRESPLAKRIAAEQAHWPIAAREHMARLALDAAHERKPARLNRLLKAMSRMTKRHGKAVPKSQTQGATQ